MPRVSKVDDLSDELFAHLDDEMSLLTSVLDFLQNIRGFFLKSDAEGLAEYLRREQEINVDVATLRARREQLRTILGTVLAAQQTKSAATLSDVIRVADGEVKERLQDYRKRLRHVTDQIELLSRSNVVLASYSIELLNQVICQITGGEVLDRYSSTGQLHHAQGRPAYQASV